MSHPLIDLAYGCANASHSAHLAHFNVIGSNFVGLHKLYQKIYEYLDEWFDKFGERARALDVVVEARPITPDLDAGKEGALNDCVLEELDDLCEQAYTISEKYDDAEEAEDEEIEDPTSANMVLEFQAGLDKLRWMVRATLKG